MSNSGLVYILTNPSFRDDLLKIGMTTRTAEERAWEIYLGSTGVPEPFQIAYAEVCSDCALAERRVHEHLQQHRVNANREFFNVVLSSAIQVIRREVLAVNAANPPSQSLSSISTVVLKQISTAEANPTSLDTTGVEVRTTVRIDPATGTPQVAKDQGSHVRSDLPLRRRLPWTSIWFGFWGVANLLAAFAFYSGSSSIGGTLVFGALGAFCLAMSYAHRDE